MKLASHVFENGAMIPAKYTCDGENILPPLVISDVPNGAESLAIICDDPDSPSGTWVHWTIWNIDPKTREIREEEMQGSVGIEGMTTFGKRGYGGPCPGSGMHRYFFKLYALDAVLDIPEDSKKHDLEKAIEGRILAEGQLMGTYAKRK